MNKERISQILYAFSATNFITYSATKQSAFLFAGGILMIVASILLIISKKK